MTNYFELYELPVSFHPSQAAVKNKFYELSRRFHPDRFAQAAGGEMAEALRMAALNNDAYKTLKNPDATMAYILRLYNLLEEDEKYNLPPDFLMEMMDMNDVISEYEANPTHDATRHLATSGLNGQLAAWDQDVQVLTDRFDNGENTNELLRQIKDYYFRKKYLLRIKERIDRFAAR